VIQIILPAVLHAFTAGNDLYLAGNYQGAIAAYESTIREAPPSPELSYNLGNAYYKLGDIAHAILCYERTLALAPRDDDARINLKKAREALPLTEEEKVMAAESFPSSLLAHWFTLNEASLLFLSAYIPWTLLLFLLLITKDKLRRLFVRLFLIFSVPTVILGALLLGHWVSSQQRYGILIGPPGSQVIELREGPEDTALTAGSSSGGLKVRVLDSTTTAGETWYKVELPGDRVGWVTGSSLGLI